MKKIYLFSAFLFLLGWPGIAHAQSDRDVDWQYYAQDTTLTFPQIVSICDSLFLIAGEVVDTNIVEGEGTEARYRQWQRFWLPRLDSATMRPHNYGKGVMARIIAGTNTNVCALESPVQSALPPNRDGSHGWQWVGPQGSTSITSNGGQYLGRIDQMSVNPTNPNEIYIANQWGGLWHTYNATAANPADVRWDCLTDNDRNLSGIGVLAFQVDYTVTPHRIYMALGYPGNFDYLAYTDVKNHTVGLFYSPDNGQTFQNLDISAFVPDMENDLINDVLLHAVTGSSSKYLFVSTQYKLLRLDVSNIAGGSLANNKALMDMSVYLPSNNSARRFRGFGKLAFNPADHSKLFVTSTSNVGRELPLSAFLYRVDNALTCTTTNSCHTNVTANMAVNNINIARNGDFGSSWQVGSNWFFNGSENVNGTSNLLVGGFWKRINSSEDMQFLPAALDQPGCLELAVPNSYIAPGYDLEFDADLPANTKLEVYMLDDKDNLFGMICGAAVSRTLIGTVTGPVTAGHYHYTPASTGIALPGYADRVQFVATGYGAYPINQLTAEPIKLDNVVYNTVSWDFVNVIPGAAGTGRMLARGRRLTGVPYYSDAWYQYSDDNGSTWTSTPCLNESDAFTMIGTDNINSGKIYVGQQQGPYQDPADPVLNSGYGSLFSIDIATHQVEAVNYGGHADVRSVVSMPDGTLYVGNDGGLSRYTAATDWKSLNGTGFACSLPWRVASSQHTGAIGLAAHDNSILLSNYSNLAEWSMDFVGDGTDISFGKRQQTATLRLFAGSGNGNQETLYTDGGMRNNAGTLVGVPGGNIYAMPLSRIRTTYAGEYVTKNTRTHSENDLMKLGLNTGGTSGQWVSLARSGGGWKTNWPNKPVQTFAPDLYDGNFIACYTMSTPWAPSDMNMVVTQDGGSSWTKYSSVPGGSFFLDMCADPRSSGGAKRLWAGAGWYNGSGSTGTKRVFVSNDAGASWTDYSSGLPPGPVSAIVYDEQSRYLFAGTDFGVYARYADSPDSNWNCYSLNLPNCFVTSLDINQCTHKIYASLMGRGAYAADLPPAKRVSLSPDVYTDWTISSNTTVSTSQAVYRDIRVKSGATLTISGCVISMGRDRGIIVEPNATLVVNGATLTNSCGDLWQGIVLLGNGDLPQVTSVQGKVSLLNSAVIENAVAGITNYMDASHNSGGMITATEASFINNVRALDYRTYHNYTGSYAYLDNFNSFKKCSFTVNDNYRGTGLGYAFNEHVRLYENEGTRFLGCSFSNTGTDAELPRGLGIRAFGASFVVRPLTNMMDVVTDRGYFAGFAKAIDISSALFNHTAAPIIDRADFEKNTIGVCITGVNNVKTIQCNFTVGNGYNHEVDFRFDCYENIGIYTDNTAQFQIEENVFTGTTHPGTDSWRNVGVRVDNSGTNNKEIYRNTFTSLDYGSVALGINCTPQYINGHTPFDRGLRYVCNTFNNNVTDINSLQSTFVLPVSGDRGIAKNQGSLMVSAGNVFNSSGGIQLNGQNMYYYHTGGSTKPVDQDGNSILFITADAAHSCPSHLGGPVFPAGLPAAGSIDYNEIVQARIASFADSVHRYDSLMSELMTMTLDDARAVPDTVLRNALLYKSPWLPDTLVRVLADSSVLPAPMLMTIMSANPDLVRNMTLMNHLMEVPDPLTKKMRDSLHTLYDTVITARTLLDNYIRIRQDSLDGWVSMMATEYKTNDTALADSTSVPGLLLATEQLWARYEAAGFMAGKLSAKKPANKVLFDTPDKIELSPEEADMHGKVMDYWKFYTEITEYKPIYQIDSAESALLISKVTTLPAASWLVRIVEATTTSSLPVVPPGTGGPVTPVMLIPCLNAGYGERSAGQGGVTRRVKSSKLVRLEGHLLTAYPNPSNGDVSFAYRVPVIEQGLSIVIVDIRGSKVAELPLADLKGVAVWSARNSLPGMYLYKLHDGSRLIDWGKIVILK